MKKKNNNSPRFYLQISAIMNSLDPSNLICQKSFNQMQIKKRLAVKKNRQVNNHNPKRKKKLSTKRKVKDQKSLSKLRCGSNQTSSNSLKKKDTNTKNKLK